MLPFTNLKGSGHHDPMRVEEYNDFRYMMECFSDMIDHHAHRVPDLVLWYATSAMKPYRDVIEEKYADQVERALIPWIEEEWRSGRLRNPMYWRFFRDPDLFHDIHIGYRYFFCFEECVFQLQVCPNGWDPPRAHFEIGLYGWRGMVEEAGEADGADGADGAKMSEREWAYGKINRDSL
jgi:hypothetical protein